MATLGVQLGYERVEESYSIREDNSIDPTLRRRLATSLGYSLQDPTKIPSGSVIGNGGDKSLVITSLTKGENVLFLGSENASQLRAASEKVGPKGKVFDVRMIQATINNATHERERQSAQNIESIQSKANDISILTDSVDCVVADCASEHAMTETKRSVIQEFHRILRPCGRLALSDHLALEPLLSDGIPSAAEAIEASEMERYLVEIGFDDALLVNTKRGIGLGSDDPSTRGGLISSFEIFGHKSCGKNKGAKQVCRMDGERTECCAGGSC